MRGFTLVEMIFVILVVAILSVVAVNSLPKMRALNDAEIIKFKILQTQSNALGYERYDENNITCIKLNKDSLNEYEKNSGENVKYLIKSDITISGLSGDVICFDKLGRPFDGAVEENLSNLIRDVVRVKVKFEREKNLTIYPISGFVR